MIGNKKNRFFFQRDNGYFRVYANYAFDREQNHKIQLSLLLTYNVKQSRAYTICANIANWSSGFSWRLMINILRVQIPVMETVVDCESESMQWRLDGLFSYCFIVKF